MFWDEIKNRLAAIEHQQRVQTTMLYQLLKQRNIEMATLSEVLALATSITNLTDSVRNADADLRSHIADLEGQLATAKANAVDQPTLDALAVQLNAANGALAAVAAIGANTGVLATQPIVEPPAAPAAANPAA